MNDLVRARRRYWHAWINWYHVFNNDKASGLAKAKAMKAYWAARDDLNLAAIDKKLAELMALELADAA